MSDTPWLTIIGMGEDGVAGLGVRSQAALAQADVIMAPPRHLDLLGETSAQTVPWPVPFSDGLDRLETFRGQRVVVLASGDPFWFGAGTVIARHLAASEWTAHPGPSCFALAAAHLGWALERTVCLGLHAAPMPRLRRHLAHGGQAIVTLRDGDAVADLAKYLRDQGFGESTVTVFEHLGGPQERVTSGAARALNGTFSHPVCAAIAMAGDGEALTRATGQRDDIFQTDGQMTKRPVRAITLSSLAPKPHEHLWDIGGGSGSIALEWLLADPTTRATCIEPRADRAANITANADALGLSHRLTLVSGSAPEVMAELDAAQAVFVGGGLTAALLDEVIGLPARLVVNAVTLEGEAWLSAAQAEHGGELMRIEIANAKPLGRKRGWSPSYPVVQWSLIR